MILTANNQMDYVKTREQFTLLTRLTKKISKAENTQPLQKATEI